jgi:carboxypeptidase Taq
MKSDLRNFFYERLNELERLEGILNLLGWDQQVYMPSAGSGSRARQIELLSTLIHERQTDPAFLACVEELFREADPAEAAHFTNVREIRRSLQRESKLPKEFVAERSRLHALSYAAWVEAKPHSDFAAMEPHLTKIMELARQEADLVGYEEHPYDALLDVYEPYATLAQVKPLLLEIAETLARMIGGCEPSSTRRSSSPSVGESDQAKLCARLAADVGYDFDRGRLDKSPHPFQSTIGSGDVRMTTRYDEGDYLSAVFTVLHETGHALYEQGFLEQHRGTPMGSAISLGVHESQSRLWENLVGRSKPFSTYLYRVMGEYLPEAQRCITPDDLWRESNRVMPSLIRVEADEVTYSLHVVIRLLLEEALISGELNVRDLPTAWDDLYEKYLGIRATHLRDGVLQDVHWYTGLVGYFPTYALGNVYGAIMMERIRHAIPDLDTQIERGGFSPLLRWLREHVHEHGRRYTATELLTKIAGQPPTAKPFLDYLRVKLSQNES